MESRTLRLLDYIRVLEHLSSLTLSEGGRKYCLNLQPIDQLSELEKNTDILRQALRYARELLQCLQEFPALDGIFSYLELNKTLDEDALLAIRLVLECARKVKDQLTTFDLNSAPLLVDFTTSLSWPEKTWQALNRCLDQDGNIKDESTPELLGVRQEMRQVQQRCTKKVDEFLQKENISSFLQDEYLTISADRYVLALKSNFKGKVSGITHDYSQSGETCYIEPLYLVELNNNLQDLKQKEREAKHKILVYITSLGLQEYDTIYQVYNWLLEIDLLRAKVAFALEFDATIPSMGKSLSLNLKQVRNPVLLLEKHQVQPVDIELKSGQYGLIISGGNSGGKTVCLKTLGLVTLLALTALPIPVAEGSTLPYWEKVFVFLGDEQDIQAHLSTFTAQIQHLKNIWPNIDSRTLVILDEFGAGTDPSQGAALAQATVDSLLDRQSWVAVATHFPALKAYGLGKSKVRAASVLFDPQTKKPLFKLIYDQVGASQALDVAREYGFPQEIIQRAEQYLLLDGQNLVNLLERLNDLAVKREQELEELENERHKLEQERNYLQQEFKQEIEKVANEIQAYAREIVTQWKAEKLGRKQALKKLTDKKRELTQKVHQASAEKSSTDWNQLSVGETVYYLPWHRNGRLIEKDDKKRKAKVDMGGVSLWVNASELSPSFEKSSQEIQTHFYKTDSQLSKSYLDLRGYRMEEARSKLYQSLDQAILKGRTQFQIIHGRGSGTLRALVHEVLQNSSEVGSYMLAPEDQGGDGVTIVYLQ